ncbi:MAG: hypothetical protein QY323_03380 [Patescibacteria group bacterium]|nr:MAG: hypothetical protein QY323_03380 [Patescibacteria group bacterium]
MKKIILCSFLYFGCVRPTETRITNVRSVRMLDAGAFILMIDDGSGALHPRKIFAEEVLIVPDVPGSSPIWAEVVDAPGEYRGEGDRLILHVRSMEDIE